MSDLEIRLRSGCDRFAIDAGPRALLLKAADEIARLRAELSGSRHPCEARQPVLTDSEREAISAAACICEDAGRTDIAIVINEAMARLEGER